MPASLVHLPNGQTLTVSPVFGGVGFKATDLTNHRSSFPPGWTVVLNEEDSADEDDPAWDVDPKVRKSHIHRYHKPSLQNDHLFISAISNPSSADFRPPTSPTRQIAMMLWATLYWYFHQPEPDPKLNHKDCEKTPEAGRPRAEWRININKEGVFKSKSTLAKLERMGLVAVEDSSVGIDDRDAKGTHRMFVTRRAFWQMDARIFLFTLSPIQNSPFPPNSPFGSRPSSPKPAAKEPSGIDQHTEDRPAAPAAPAAAAAALTQAASGGPFQSASHLPTYYPPHPPLYVYTNHIRHPLRPKPFRQGETFYARYVPSLGQYISFRVASLSPTAPSQHGPWSAAAGTSTPSGLRNPQRSSLSDSILPTMTSFNSGPSDVELLHKWMNDPRVAHSWGEDGPESHQEQFLRQGLTSKHCFPAIGCFDGKPFGYFEIYWVKEDKLGTYLGRSVGDWDRGIHLLVGEQEFRGPHRVKVWLSALVHYCWLADMRTDCVMLEPRVDNTKLANYCYDMGFHKEREVTFPHKQSNLLKIYRDTWESPAL